MNNPGRLPVWLAFVAIVLWFGLSYRFWPLPAVGEVGCHGSTTAVEQIQGTGSVTPLDGETILTEGVVSADFTGREQLGGFFIQQAQATDAGAASGLFVYALGTNVTPGERVRVRGQAGEYHGMTQLSDARIVARCGQPGRPEPTTLTLPANDAEREALEGMRVRLEQGATITGLYELGRYGVVTLADDRLYQPTQVAEPGPAARTVREGNETRRLRLDDGSRRQFPELPEWVTRRYEAGNRLRLGDRLVDVTGVLDYRYDAWRLQPTEPPDVKVANPPPEPLERPAPGRFRIASFNLQNYFNGDGQGGGFPTDRGADSLAAWQTQHRRLVTALDGLAADIVGLVELENDGTGPDSAIASLVGDLEGDWNHLRPEQRPGDGAIAVGLAWREARVEPVGDPEILREPPFNQGSRPPLAQRFRHRASGVEFLVVVNHFKSKRCGDATGNNADRNDGQSCWSAHRSQAARRLMTWLTSLTASMDQRKTVLVGDLNAYAQETPVSLLSQAGYRNVLAEHHAMPASSYVYRAESGTLDYIRVSTSLEKALEAAGIWAINADEPAMLHYRRKDQVTLPEAVTVPAQAPWRASDHDPTWADLAPGTRHER